MSTREARTRATAAWRSRTSAKPVQIYLHPETLAALDALVAERGAQGRAAVLTTLIEAAAEARQSPVDPAPVDALPEPVGEPAAAPAKRQKPRHVRERVKLRADLLAERRG